MVRIELEKAIKEELRSLGVKGPKFELEHPTDKERGDYATNVALIYAKKLNRDPIELAGDLVQNLKKRNIKYVAKITVAGFGFINFHLEPQFFEDSIKNILDSKRFGLIKRPTKKKIMVEYTDPNIFKVFHIGHLMANTIGEAISRLVEWNGAEVKRANYQGDVGMHIAKALYGMKDKSFSVLKEKLIGNTKSRVKFLGEAYVEGARVFEEDKEAQKKIIAINKKVYERNDPIINTLYDLGKTWSLDYFETVYKKLGTKFDYYFFESETAPLGQKIIDEFLKKQVFEESDGAIVYKGEADGLHTRVFRNSEGLPTYEAKDLGLIQKKLDTYKFDKSISITGSEQNDYFKVILSVAKKIFPKISGDIIHISHGMLMLPSGKMSSRKGEVISAEDLLNQIEGVVEQKMSDRDIARGAKKEIIEMVAIGALKFSILKQAPGRDIVFDFDKSLSFEGDSGPYLQYTAVRAESVLEKARKEEIEIDSKRKIYGEGPPLERIIYQFPEVVERAGDDYAPQLVVTYLLEVASTFNNFYASTKIINTEDDNASYYLSLTKATREVLVNGLEILGIKTPNKM